MKNIIIGLSSIILVSIAAWVFQNNQEETALDVHQPISTPNALTPLIDKKLELPNQVELPQAMISINDEPDLDLVISDDHINMSDVEPIPAWSEPQLGATSPSFNVSEAVTEKRQVTFNANSMEKVTSGDKFAFPMPSGEEYVANVESSSTFKNGSTSWQGHLDGYGDQYPVVFTTGKSTAFATITTPEGSFTLETVDGQGWVYKNPEVDDAGHEDSLIIPPVQQFQSQSFLFPLPSLGEG